MIYLITDIDKKWNWEYFLSNILDKEDIKIEQYEDTIFNPY